MKTYTYDEVRSASIEYFNGDELSADVFAGKYALQDLKGNLYELTPVDMHHRLAKEFARIEQKYPNPMLEDEIYELFADWSVVPQGGPMSAIGNPYQVQSLSNCFVIESPHDSYGGILKTDQEQIQIMKRRGGVGFDLSTIRPQGVSVSNAARTTDGIAVFMERYSNSCREVAQAGRRGALMATIDCHHPQVLTFANIKRDRQKVTGANVSVRVTDEFMHAVRDNVDYQQRFPVEKDVKHSVEQNVNAKKVWKEIVSAMRDCSEPGMLFWGTIIDRSPADAYAKYGFKTISTNPCLTGGVKIATADGRGSVPIKQLADEGRDVPVYAYCENTGKLVVRTMRNPRLTGENVPVFKVTIEGNHSFKATGNHVMIMRDGARKRVDELVSGDQLMISKRIERTLVEMNASVRSTNPSHYVMIENHKGSCCEHRMIWEYYHGKIPVGHVIHHRNFDSKDNRVANLRCMGYLDHQELHASCMRGENNPIFKIKADPKRFAEYRLKLSTSLSGNNNPRAYNDVLSDDIRRHVLKQTKEIGRRMSRSEWYSYAKVNGMPQSFSSWRRIELGSFYDLSLWAANELGFKNVALDPRTQRVFVDAIEQGYDVDVINDEVCVNRMCEWCGEEFMNSWGHREIAFCSRSCSNFYANRKAGGNEARKTSLQVMHLKNAEQSRKAILDCYTELRFKLNRTPTQDELRALCKERGNSYRTGTKHGFKNFADIKQYATLHNHRVVSVEPCGNEDVYNGTVDEEHNYCFGGWDLGNNEKLQVHSQNCGEVPLSAFDSCRLLLINLCKFVIDPFTSNARFDYESFASTSQKAQRLMDDLIDLECEAIDLIIKKIKSDPEPIEVKQIELNLWYKIKKSASDGRRTGLGITALGDVFAYMCQAYGSDESIALTEKIYRSLAVNSYKSSVLMAATRGAFPVYSYEVEKDRPFIMQIMDADPELKLLYQQHGRRNIANTTTPPAGSTSILTQTTSGCEPVLFIKARRKRKINPSDKQARVDEIDKMGDKWQYYDVLHPGVTKWAKVTGETDLTKSPYHMSTVEDIDWMKRIDVQAAAQKWVCHGISSTINLPRDVSVETVEKLCWHAWETGCKGITIYRIGSRDAVIVKEHDQYVQPSEIIETHAPKRPRELPCDIHRASVQGSSYLVLVGTFEGKPYEVFAGLQEHVEVPKKFKQGVLIKNGKNKEGFVTYNLKIPVGDDEELLFKDIVNLFDNPMHGVLTRTISLSLRHGIPIQYVIEQLQKDKRSDVTSFSRCIARVLSKEYIADGTKVTIEKTCDQCGSTQLQYQAGCVTCVGCGWSKCG